MPPLFPLTSQSIVGHALNALSFHWNLLESNGYASGAVPDFVCHGTFDTSGGIVYIANTRYPQLLLMFHLETLIFPKPMMSEEVVFAFFV